MNSLYTHGMSPVLPEKARVSIKSFLLRRHAKTPILVRYTIGYLP